MRLYGKFFSLLLLITFLLTSLNVAFAQSNEIPKVTKENAKEIVQQAKNGNVKATEALLNLKMFDHEEVAKKLNGTKVFAGTTQEILFDDESSIGLEYIMRAYDPSTGTEIPIYNSRSGDIIHTQALYKWYAAGVEVSRYTVHTRYLRATNPQLLESWDTGSASPFFTCSALGTSVLDEVGPYAIGITGRGSWSSVYGGSQTVKVNTYNYFDFGINWAEYWIW